MDKILQEIKKFHGHLGPYAVIGYKMGLIANEKLGNDPFKKNAEVWTGSKPPISCIVDGIQLSSGCTMGKGNIRVIDKNKAKSLFTNNNGKKVSIELKKEIINDIEKNVTDKNIESYAQQIYKKIDSDLFNFIF